MKFIITILGVCLSFIVNGQQTVGLFQNDSLAFNGYTLLTPLGSSFSYLIDNCGRVVHSWESNEGGGGASYLSESGHLYRGTRTTNPFFSGWETGGHIEKFNWEGDLVWDYDYSNGPILQHHDFALMPNGNLLILAWEYRTATEAIQAGRNPDLVDQALFFTHVSEIELVGTDTFNVVWQWSLFDHLIQDFDDSKDNFGVITQSKGKLNINYSNVLGTPTNPDFMHCNSITYNPEYDQIAISGRRMSEMYIIDHSTTISEAMTDSGGTYGKGGDFLYRWGNPQVYGLGTEQDRNLFRQHDVTWVNDEQGNGGRFLCFNNQWISDTQSSVIEWKAPMESAGVYHDTLGTAFGPANEIWSYSDSNLFSGQMSGTQRLPNGNTFIIEGNSGVLQEVDTSGNVVWKYINPDSFSGITTQGFAPVFNSVFKAQKYSASFQAFENETLIPNNVLELEPYPSSCIIYPEPEDSIPPDTTANSIIDFEVASAFQLAQKPGIIKITAPTLSLINWQVFDSYGKILKAGKNQSSPFQIATEGFAAGCYFVRLVISNSVFGETQKIFVSNQ